MKKSRYLASGFLLLIILTFTFPRLVFAQSNIAFQGAAEKKAGEGYACWCVAFRLDDVDDVNHPEIEGKLLDIFQNSNTSLTVGIIGNRFGNNQEIVSHLVAMLEAHPQILEVANHGWNHEDFTALPLEQQAVLMQKTNEKIHSVLKVNSTVFIAPFNKVDNSTFLAAKKSGINTISSNPAIDPPAPKVLPDLMGMYHLPYSTVTAYVDKDGKHWDYTPLDKIKRDIVNALREHGYAVVEMHPQEFAPRDPEDGVIDEAHLAAIEELIHSMHSEKINFVTLGSFSAKSRTVPEFESASTIVAVLAIASTIALDRVMSKRNARPTDRI